MLCARAEAVKPRELWLRSCPQSLRPLRLIVRIWGTEERFQSA